MFRIQTCAALVALSYAGLAQADVPQAAGETVVVTANRIAQPVSKTLSDVSVITRDDIETSGAQTLADVLSRQGAANLVSNGGPGSSTGLSLRGANATHTLVLLDGVRIVSATTGSTALQAIPLEQVERIEILRGPASSLYGADAIGGVVQIFTRKGAGEPRFNASAGLGSHGTSKLGGGVSGKSGNTAYSLQLSHEDSAGFSAQNDHADNAFYTHNPDRDGYRNDGYNASATQTLAAGHELTLRLFQTFSKADFDQSPKAQDRTDTRLTGQSLESKNAFTGNWTSTLRYARSQDKQETFNNGDLDHRSSLFETTQREWLWQNDVKTGLGDATLGLTRTGQDVSVLPTALSRDSRSNKAAFASYQGELGSHLLQASLRRDQDSQFGGKNTGKLGYGYQFAEGWVARASYGTAFKAPTFNDLYYPYVSFGPGWGSYQGNPNLRPEYARNGEAALQYRLNGTHASLTAYHNKVNDLIAYSTDANFNGTMINVNKAVLRGLTLNAGSKLYGIDVDATLDLLDARDGATGHWLPRRARQSATLSASRDFGAWTVGTEYQARGQRYDDLANSKPLHGYALANVFADYRFAKNWTASARLDNVFGREYETTYGYNTGGFGAFVGVRYNQ